MPEVFSWKNNNKYQKRENLFIYTGTRLPRFNSYTAAMVILKKVFGWKIPVSKTNHTYHSLIRGVVRQSCPTGAKNFTNYVYLSYFGGIQNIENHCAIRAKLEKIWLF